MSVKILKLISGDTLIGDIEEKENTITAKNPVTIAMTNKGIGLAPFIPFMKAGTIEVKKDHVLCEAELETEILNAYNSQFGSGIVMADAQSTLKIRDF